MLKEFNTLLPIDTSNPVNRIGKLNTLLKGLQLWYLSIPYVTGGSTWYDVMQLRHGSLTASIMNSNAGWIGKSWSPYFGCLRFNGTTNRLKVIPPNLLTGKNSNQAHSISCWIRPHSPPVGYGVILSHSNTNGLYLRNTGTVLKIDFFFNNDALSTLNLKSNIWYHVVAVCNANSSNPNGNIYINGILDSTFSQITNVNIPYENIGDDASSESLDADLDSLMVWDRALSSQEAYNLYIESLAGFPNLLNRVPIFDLLLLRQYFTLLVEQQKLPFILRVG